MDFVTVGTSLFLIVGHFGVMIDTDMRIVIFLPLHQPSRQESYLAKLVGAQPRWLSGLVCTAGSPQGEGLPFGLVSNGWPRMGFAGL